ncbi:MAG TPA: DsbA family protein [Acidimicrobiales bacterium]|nr:DsbA family protein [Acidimicrobiales bacterium]
MADATPLAPLDDAPHDIEFFFDPACPFAWLTSRWVQRVVELRGISVGWRFISLAYINRDAERSPAMRESHERGLRFHRVCAAARQVAGNDAVGRLYTAWGERLWYPTPEAADGFERMAKNVAAIDVPEILEVVDLPVELVAAMDDDSHDAVLQLESDEAFRRTGPDVGTPIITYDPPHGNSLFGPVISAVPDDERAVAFYDALRVFVDFPEFSELKRTDRKPLDLPLFQD